MKNIINNNTSLDDVGGVLTEPLGDYTPYNVRALFKYCGERNIEPIDLTEEQLKQFEVKPTN